MNATHLLIILNLLVCILCLQRRSKRTRKSADYCALLHTCVLENKGLGFSFLCAYIVILNHVSIHAHMLIWPSWTFVSFHVRDHLRPKDVPSVDIYIYIYVRDLDCIVHQEKEWHFMYSICYLINHYKEPFCVPPRSN